MGHSSLLGLDPAESEAAGHDTGALGPSDSSDSGSDVAGIEVYDVEDPTLPVDVALNDDSQHMLMPAEALSGGSSDSAGSGERRSAGSDAGVREAADISVDRVFDPASEGDPDADEDPDLAFIDEAEAGDPMEDEDIENDDASDIRASATEPGHPNPEPDAPGDSDGDDSPRMPDEDEDAEHRKPGRG